MSYVETLRSAVNDACTCGGGGPDTGCPACRVWHQVRHEMEAADSMTLACNLYALEAKEMKAKLDGENVVAIAERQNVERLATRLGEEREAWAAQRRDLESRLRKSCNTNEALDRENGAKLAEIVEKEADLREALDEIKELRSVVDAAAIMVEKMEGWMDHSDDLEELRKRLNALDGNDGLASLDPTGLVRDSIDAVPEFHEVEKDYLRGWFERFYEFAYELVATVEENESGEEPNLRESLPAVRAMAAETEREREEWAARYGDAMRAEGGQKTVMRLPVLDEDRATRGVGTVIFDRPYWAITVLRSAGMYGAEDDIVITPHGDASPHTGAPGNSLDSRDAREPEP